MRVESTSMSHTLIGVILCGICILTGCDTQAPPSMPAPSPPDGASQPQTSQPQKSQPATLPPGAAESAVTQSVGEEQAPAETAPMEAATPSSDSTAGEAGGAQDQGDPSATPSALGAELYARHCAACHGETGDGRGIAATHLFPKPRDFHASRFRLVSTANNVPSREDLHAVLLRGMPGSSMPPWSHLSQAERAALVDEIMRLRKLGARPYYIKMLKEQEELTDEEIAEDDVQQDIQDFVDNLPEPGETSVVPEIGEPTEESLVRAQETYAKFGCLQCHGKEGKGDGVEKMVDSEGYATAPRDFTAGIFKGGDDPASLYRRIAYGMPGTPMPSSQQMTPEAMVDMVHYIRSMSTEERRKAAVLNREKIVVKARGSLPTGASEAEWHDIPKSHPRTAPLWWRNGADYDLQVQGVHDGQSIALRISWKDAQQDGHAAASEAFEDALAVELYRGKAEPFLGMGNTGTPVDVWFWDADRQGRPLAVEDLYPRSVVDVYPFSETVVASAELDRNGARTADQPDVALPARAVGNQIVPTGDGLGGSSLVGGGPGTSTFRIPTSQHVRAIGEWRDGLWTITMTRPLILASPDDGISLEPGVSLSVAFAIWDGVADDRDGRKSITIWQDMILEQ